MYGVLVAELKLPLGWVGGYVRDPIKDSQTASQTTRTDRAKGGGWRKREGCVCCLLPLLFDMAISIIHETYIHMYLLRGKSTFSL